MKYYKRLKQWKASNVIFDVEKCEATSYKWWIFVKRIGGKLVFNDYRYSNTTSKHQYKVKRLLNQLGIIIDVIISSPNGLQNLDSAIDYNNLRINLVGKDLNNPRARKSLITRRKQLIENYNIQLNTIKEILKNEEFHNKFMKGKSEIIQDYCNKMEIPFTNIKSKE